MDWQKLFAPWILERGRDYWDDGCVESLDWDGNTVTALVSGTEDYDVEIEMGRGGKIADTLLHHPTTRTLKYELLAFGEQYELLYQSIVQEGSFNRLRKFADILCRWSPEQVRDTYVRMLDGVMSRSTDRNMYREAIGCLRRVRQFPAGAEAEKQLADSWRVQFGRRKAMLDELRKAGY